MNLDKAIKTRHSIRRFNQIKKPSYSKILNAIEAATLAPAAGNLSTLRYIFVQDKEKIKSIAVAAQQEFITTVPYVVVVCSDKKALEKFYYDRAEKYSKEQSGAAIQNYLLKINEQGLASCWIGAFSEKTVKNLLKIPDNVDVIALLPTGYSLDKSAPHHLKKPQLDKVVFYDAYKNSYMKPLAEPEYQ